MELFQGALTNLSSLFRGRERRKRPQSQGKNRAGEADQNGKRKKSINSSKLQKSLMKGAYYAWKLYAFFLNLTF